VVVDVEEVGAIGLLNMRYRVFVES
jgi:hypothetical protein